MRGNLRGPARPPRAAGRAPRRATGGSRRRRPRTASGTPPARTTRTGRRAPAADPSVSQRFSSLTKVASTSFTSSQHAAVADVEDVVAQLVARMREVAAAELRQAGHPGPDHEARRVVADLAHRRREEHRPDRPRADQVHVAADDVPELRDLVELRALQEAADRRVERIARRQQARADALLGVDQQGAELVDRGTAPCPRPMRVPR